MAIQYVVTEEEMLSLIDQIKLVTMQDNNIWREDLSKPVTADEMHRAFHYVVVRWVQAMGFKGHR
jgi:hypothetical protein